MKISIIAVLACATGGIFWFTSFSNGKMDSTIPKQIVKEDFDEGLKNFLVIKKPPKEKSDDYLKSMYL